MDQAAVIGASSRVNNNGQACTNAKRFIVHEKIYNKFLEKVKAELDKLIIGDPRSEDTTLGPLVSEESVYRLRKQTLQSIQKGATVAYGDISQLTKPLDASKGFFFTPIILENIPKDAKAYSEELFGPVFSFFKFRNDQEAIDLANSSKYGLAGTVFSRNMSRAESIAFDLESGSVSINGILPAPNP